MLNTLDDFPDLIFTSFPWLSEIDFPNPYMSILIMVSCQHALIIPILKAFKQIPRGESKKATRSCYGTWSIVPGLIWIAWVLIRIHENEWSLAQSQRGLTLVLGQTHMLLLKLKLTLPRKNMVMCEMIISGYQQVSIIVDLTHGKMIYFKLKREF